MDVHAKIKEAMYARKAYIKKNMETLTLKAVRRLLEKDLNMDAGSMDEYKSEAKEMLDRVLAEISDDDNVKKAAQPSKPKADKPKPKKGTERESAQARSAAAGSSSQPPAVQKMQKICKQAGIGVGPNIYRKPDVAAAFRELLAKHGLSAKSDASEIARVRKKLEEQRDMEGIDMSNIVEGGRRSRQQTSYRKMVEHDEDDENEEEEPRRKRSKVTVQSSRPTDVEDSDDFDDLDDDADNDDAAPGETAKSAKAPKRARVVFDDGEDDDDVDEAGRGRARGITIAESTNTTAATKAEPPLAEPPAATSDDAEEEDEELEPSSEEEADSDDDFDE